MGFMMLENVKKIIFALVAFPVFVFCLVNDQNESYISYAKDIMNEFIKQSTRDYKIDCIGSGGGFAKNVDQIAIKFVAYRRATVEEARELEVSLIKNLLERINTDKRIKPYLSEYPFKAKNLDISVSFRKKNAGRYLDESVALVFLARGKIFYDYINPKTEELVTIMNESYEEALKIVNSAALTDMKDNEMSLWQSFCKMLFNKEKI